MKQSQRIAKNISVMVLAEVFGFGLNFVLVVIIARYLGAVQFGKYSFVMAFVWVFQIIADSGLSNIMIREIAVNRENLEYQLGVTKSLMWVFSILTFAVIALGVYLLNPEMVVKDAIYVMGLAVLATVHAVGYSSVFRALEEMEYNAIGFVLHKALLLALVMAVIKLRMGLVQIAGAYLISNISLWVMYYVITSLRYQRPRVRVDVRAWWYLLSEAIPIGIASILRKISWQIDILILSAIGSTLSVGLFSAPYKVVQSINMLPLAISMPLFPFYSRLAKSSSKELFAAYEKSLRLMCLLSIPLVVILAAFSHSIVSLVFGREFQRSHAALEILSVTILFLFPTSQFIYLFSALGRQRLYTICSLVSLGANILIDFILIPRFDFIGACLGTLIAEMLLFAMGMYYVKTIEKDVSFMRALWKPLVAGIVMSAAVMPFRDSGPYVLVAGGFAGVFAYFVSILVLKTFSKSELDRIKESLRFSQKLTGGPAEGVDLDN